ncbi:tyrosine-type recombinase/integrase [Paraburkholderia adhaesiva]|uniref:tyrosine-type recombinase/integrase n=1 Tax=Paraburkholderia adhaesiva TaxID=2883244 RepID=UPI0027E5B43F|nr:tyrosine-type recombinase/integrase [Paraburkholderia adhaesiva]
MRPSGSLRHFLGSFASIIAGSGPGQTTYPTVRICAATSDSLVVNEKGEGMTADALRFRFDRARKVAGVEKGIFQFRDLRAKAGTDKAESSGDIRAAQLQLGHTSVVMTEHYVRERKGDKVEPTK